ncbi:hypothetical protein [Sedimenticola selenatireducens]|uniref:hypothetical protein n=1 Tax=Sedimenticola selenatireducens TaxID=191960 RepID=UPI002AAB6EF3|nr:hypothetical protein [Sedimenticola selenatireducens]
MTDWLAELDQIEPETSRMTGKQERAIREWLDFIEEIDPITITEILDKCDNVLDARSYFLERSKKVSPGGS